MRLSPGTEVVAFGVAAATHEFDPSKTGRKWSRDRSYLREQNRLNFVHEQ